VTPWNLVLAAALAVAGVQPQPVPASAAPQAAEPGTPPATIAPKAVPKLVLPKGTMVRLMVVKEINSRDNKPGDRFVLRVDEDVRVNGAILVPVGAKAWGEVTNVQGTGGAGKSGKLNARLLYLEAAGRHIDLEGERQSAGSGGTGQVVGGVVAFGLFGLLMKGNNATLKAGDILNGYTVADTLFDQPVVASAQ
jgi:hypothetical protein